MAEELTVSFLVVRARMDPPTPEGTTRLRFRRVRLSRLCARWRALSSEAMGRHRLGMYTLTPRACWRRRAIPSTVLMIPSPRA
jgi:hypothetical protein